MHEATECLLIEVAQTTFIRHVIALSYCLSTWLIYLSARRVKLPLVVVLTGSRGSVRLTYLLFSLLEFIVNRETPNGLPSARIPNPGTKKKEDK